MNSKSDVSPGDGSEGGVDEALGVGGGTGEGDDGVGGDCDGDLYSEVIKEMLL